MPLIHSKTPKAFKKNVEIEIAHGKPQKQAVAIAYHEKAEAEHKNHAASGGCIGPMCKGCHDPKCFADGGQVDDSSDSNPKPSDDSQDPNAWTSNPTPYGSPLANLKSGLGMAQGGAVTGMTESGYEKGINRGRKLEGGQSYAGVQARGGAFEGQSKAENESDSKETHRKTLSEIQSMKSKDRTNLAEGGEVEEMNDDDLLSDGLGEELMHAMDSKDRKAIMSCIEACVAHCMSKGMK